MNVIIRASFKSAVSRGNSYNSYNFYSCEEGELEGGAPGVRAGLVNDGYQTQVSVAYYADHRYKELSSVSCTTVLFRFFTGHSIGSGPVC